MLEVSTPLGESMIADVGYKSYPVLVADKVLHTDLIVLPLLDFDLILGMDWLFMHHTSIDYRSKVVTFTIPD